MLRKASYTIAALLSAVPAVPAAAQVPGGDTLAVVAAAHRHVVEAAGRETWPGFRPDTIPHRYVLPGRGSLLLGWRGPLPAGWTVVEGAGWMPEARQGAASTGIEMQGRGVAQVVVRTLDPLALAGVTVHESFHVHQRASRVEGRRFGAGENSMLLARYPVFSVDNEAGMALEGALLLAALCASDPADARERVREFLAVRAVRQRGLPAEMSAFEDAAEMNEGLAEYVLHRATAADVPPSALRAALADLLGNGAQSIRLRFYQTGSAMAHLLNRIGAPGWKAHALANDLTLAAALAHAVGAAGDADSVAAAAGERLGIALLRDRAARSVASLRAARVARADSVLAGPGVVLRVSGERLGARINPCGFDPQNLLMVDERRLLHTRWLRICTGADFQAEFNTPVVEDGGSFTAGAGAEVRITAGGREVRLAEGERIGGAAEVRVESPSLTLTAARADVERAGRMIVIHPLPRD
jgi:hypothetical protein